MVLAIASYPSRPTPPLFLSRLLLSMGGCCRDVRFGHPCFSVFPFFFSFSLVVAFAYFCSFCSFCSCFFSFWSVLHVLVMMRCAVLMEKEIVSLVDMLLACLLAFV